MSERQWRWDHRFLRVAELVATWSKDPSTQVGAVLVRPDLTIASTGFNGFPRGCEDRAEVYAHRPTKYSRVVHAEMNAILQCRDASLAGYTLYVTPPGDTPTCDRCAAHVIQAGIARVVCREYGERGNMDARWRDAWEAAFGLYNEAGVTISHISPVYEPAL